ncbi:MAG: hypothetical protein FD167_3168 [bacterium]|nr:MAG: hypothetical protein FD167_3168 [bacterium]
MAKLSTIIKFMCVLVILLASCQLIIAQTKEIESDKESQQELARTKLYQGQYLQAVELFQKLVTSQTSPQTYYLLGLAYSNSGQTEPAITAFKKVIELKPNYIRVYASLGEVYARLEQRQEALDIYNKALSIKPKNDIDDYIGLGNVNDAVGRKPEAIAAYQQAVKLKPDDPEAHFFLGGSYFDLGKVTEAIAELKEAIKLRSDFAAPYTFLGVVYGQTGNFSESIEPLKKAIMLNPNDLASRQFLAMVYVNLKDKGSALKEYEAIKTIDEKVANELIAEINKLAPTETATKTASTPTVTIIKQNDRARIGLVPFANKSGRPVSTDMLLTSLADILLGNNFDIIRLIGKTSEDIIAEANKNNCDYILSTEITELLLGNRAGASSGKIFNSGEDQEGYDVIVSFNLFGKGRVAPLIRGEVKGRAEGSPDRAVFAAITEQARIVTSDIKKKNK